MQGIISPNMLKTYELCPKKFYFRYIKKISMPVNDDIFETGKNIHALASYYLRKENIDKLEKSLHPQELELWNYLKNIEYFSYEFIASEYNLSLRIGEEYFGGRIDALVKNGDKYYILDYKTGTAPKNAKYDFQTMIYLLAVRSFYKTDDVVFIYIDLKNKTNVEIPLTAELAEEYTKKLLDTSSQIASENFIRKTNKCNCEYNIICY